MNVQELLLKASALLQSSSQSPRLDAELLLCHVLQWERLRLVSEREHAPKEADCERFFEFVQRRARFEPVAYIVGKKEFYGLEFEVDPAVLVPRPETELLVERALGLIAERGRPLKIVDLGAGSGCIVVSLAKTLGQQHRYYASDLSEDALNVASKNAARHGVEELIHFRQGTWFEPFDGESFDLILSNPPYVDQDSPERSPELQFEPSEALYSEDRGLADLKSLLADSGSRLLQGGNLLFEIGAEQSEALLDLQEELCFRELCVHKDLAGFSRLIEGKL